MLLANRQGVEALSSALSLLPGCSTWADYLKGLELRDGGDGNGVVLIKQACPILYEKGVHLSVERIASWIEKEDYDWVLFHTREASVGAISDENCHPYFVDGKRKLFLAANGSELTMSALGKVLGNRSDSEFIARMIVALDLPLFETFDCFQSNFMGFCDGKPYVYKGDREMLLFAQGEGVVFASDFPFALKGLKPLPEGERWMDGTFVEKGVF